MEFQSQNLQYPLFRNHHLLVVLTCTIHQGHHRLYNTGFVWCLHCSGKLRCFRLTFPYQRIVTRRSCTLSQVDPL